MMSSNIPTSCEVFNSLEGLHINGLDFKTLAQDAIMGQLNDCVVVQEVLNNEKRNEIAYDNKQSLEESYDKSLPLHNGSFKVIQGGNIGLDKSSFVKGKIATKKTTDVLNSKGTIMKLNTSQIIDPNVITRLKPNEDYREFITSIEGPGAWMNETVHIRTNDDDFSENGFTPDMTFTSGSEFRSGRQLAFQTDSVRTQNKYIAFAVSTPLLQEREALERSANYQQAAMLDKLQTHNSNLERGFAAARLEMLPEILFGSKADDNKGSILKPITATGDATLFDTSSLSKPISEMTLNEIQNFVKAQVENYMTAHGIGALYPNLLELSINEFSKLSLETTELVVGPNGAVKTTMTKLNWIKYFYDQLLSQSGETLEIKPTIWLNPDKVAKRTNIGASHNYIFSRKLTTLSRQDGIYYNAPIPFTLISTLLPTFQNVNGVVRTDFIFAQLNKVFAPRGKLHQVYSVAA